MVSIAFLTYLSERVLKYIHLDSLPKKQVCNTTFLSFAISDYGNISNMSEKHLSKGSTNPPRSKGKLRLYSMRFCPYAQRAVLVLDVKKIPYDVVNIDLKEKPSWYLEMNPQGKVPALELESGEIIIESLVIADYLDEKYPQPPLYPQDSAHKTKDKKFIEDFSKVTQNIGKFYGNKNKENFDNIFAELNVYERELQTRGKTFFGGEKPGMLDLMIWPFCERIGMFKHLAGDQFISPREKFPKLTTWANEMKQNDAVKLSYIEPEIHAKFFQSHQSGHPDYDMLIHRL